MSYAEAAAAAAAATRALQTAAAAKESAEAAIVAAKRAERAAAMARTAAQEASLAAAEAAKAAEAALTSDFPTPAVRTQKGTVRVNSAMEELEEQENTSDGGKTSDVVHVPSVWPVVVLTRCDKDMQLPVCKVEKVATATEAGAVALTEESLSESSVTSHPVDEDLEETTARSSSTPVISHNGFLLTCRREAGGEGSALTQNRGEAASVGAGAGDDGVLVKQHHGHPGEVGGQGSVYKGVQELNLLADSTNAAITPADHLDNLPRRCNVCRRTFGTARALHSHRCIETDTSYDPVWPWVCSTCGKQFQQACHLMEHKRLHTGERPYSCSYCGIRFTRGDALKIHVITQHTFAYPYSCTRCGKGFVRPSLLRVHAPKCNAMK